MMQEIKLVAFDMGGVLVDADESIPIQEFSRLSRRTSDQVFQAVFSADRKLKTETGQITPREFSTQAASELGLALSEAEFWSVHISSHSIILESSEIVRSTAGQTTVALASNLPEPHAQWASKQLPAWDLFEPRILSFEIGVMKPDPAYFEELIRQAGAPASSILFIDDNLVNVESARSVGIEAEVSTDPATLREVLKKRGFDV